MRVTFWGSRGSIPVSGKEYLNYGGDTTCVEIRTKDDRTVIVDAGTGIRRLGRRLMEEGRHRYDILFTHAHWDHLMGFPFFRPIYSDRTRIQMQGCPFAQQFVESTLAKVMSPPNFPVRYADIKARIQYQPECPERIEIGSLSVSPIALSHANQGKGFKFQEDGKCFVFLTDNELDFLHKGGLPFEAYEVFSADADLLVHDAEFTPEEYHWARGWGHTLFTTALELAIRAKVKCFGLFHLNQDRTDRQVEQMVDACRRIIRERDARLECFAVAADTTLEL